jgi:diaminopimelate decarboxylase
VAAGVTIEMESATELQRVTAAGERLGIRPRVAVRVNPDFAVRGSGMRMGGGPQQFGIDAEAVPELMESVLARDLDFQGFHIFAGSQNLNAQILAEAQQRIVDLVIRLSAAAGVQPRYLNIGGGFGIPYSSKDAHLDVPLLGNRLQSLVQDVVRPALGAVRIAIELGRYVVGEAGVYLTRVVDRKVSRGVPFIVVDGGLHHQLAASGNFGQAIRRNYPVANAGRMNEDNSEMQNVVGCLCTPLDVLAEKVMLPPAQVGDLVAVFMAGAYGFTASPTAFLGHPPPLELLV